MTATTNKIVPSITEWMQKINIPNIERFRREDITKRQRLEVLNRIIGLPYLKAEKLTPEDIFEKNPAFKKVAKKNRGKVCLFKLLPKNPRLPKLRFQGKFEACLKWIKAQKINPSKYQIDVVLRPKKILYSSIFCVDDKGIWGELIHGPIWQFSEGTYKSDPFIFFYNYKKWWFSAHNKAAERVVKNAVARLRLKKYQIRRLREEKLTMKAGAKGHLRGYFEFIFLPDHKIYFVDFNRLLYRLLRKSRITISHQAKCLNGVCIGPGRATGQIKKIFRAKPGINFRLGDILVCKLVTFDLLPYIKRAGAIITEQGTVLSHAAIISRELKKPYVANVKNATSIFKDKETVLVDATKGKIIKL